MRTGFLYDPRFLDHDTGHGHPESAARLRASIDYLQKQPWFGDLQDIAANPAEEQWLREIHSAAYIARAARACREQAPYLDCADVSISADSYEVALLAAGGALAVADAVMEQRIDNGFALLRPPGHHAEHDQALGFCLFNNVAITARYLQRRHDLDKILILDWDVHHGNGTQHSFEYDPSVLYISLHQYPFYPGSGAYDETGSGNGRGATLNCPQPAGSGDTDYERAFRDRVLPAIDHFRPQAILISAGFDAHRDDPLADVHLSSGFYGWMTRRLMEAADAHAGGRIISLLEGGYNLCALPECIAIHLATLADYRIEPLWP